VRKLLSGAFFAALAASSAVAADMAPFYAKAPPAALAAPAANWTGLYVDSGVGYGMWTADTTTITPTTGICDLCVTQTQGGKGWLGAIGGGYDYQFKLATYNLVIGALGGYDFNRLSGTIQDQNPFFVGTEKMTSAWAAGARLGWLATPSILTYVNGGFSHARFSGTNLVGASNDVASGNTTPVFSRGGWFIGTGTEILLGGSWFARSEYRYADYGTAILPDTGIVPGQDFITFHPVVQSVRTELVWKFNWIK